MSMLIKYSGVVNEKDKGGLNEPIINTVYNAFIKSVPKGTSYQGFNFDKHSSLVLRSDKFFIHCLFCNSVRSNQAFDTIFRTGRLDLTNAKDMTGLDSIFIRKDGTPSFEGSSIFLLRVPDENKIRTDTFSTSGIFTD